MNSITEPTGDYELLDSGEGEKLERYGEVVLVRPDPQALWPKKLDKSEWEKCSARFERTSVSGKWKVLKDIPKPWRVTFEESTFELGLFPSKHVGLFPEQVSGWKWLKEKIQKEIQDGRKISVLNLFGYTGGATLSCAQAGATVCHVDASKFVVDGAMKNRDASGLPKAPIRFIVDDARKFVERQIKRGNTYDVVVMDPPVYGKGLKDEVWKLEEDLLPLLSRVQKILSKDPVAIVLNGYASGYSHVTYAQILGSVTGALGGSVSSGEMMIRETSSQRLLPAGIFARWEK